MSLIRFIKWQINLLINPYAIVYPFTDRAKLLVSKGMTGATGNLYCGLHEFVDMSFLLHFLREGDLFLDVGANVGSYSVLASSHVGSRTVAIEPSPKTFSHLMANVFVNDIASKVVAFNLAVGNGEGVVEFTTSHDATNHVALPNDEDKVQVPITTLDKLLAGFATPCLIKIDVEGFETQVIRGARQILMNRDVKAVIIELNGSGVRYGHDESEIHSFFKGVGFRPYSYDPYSRKISQLKMLGPFNTLYIRDLEFAQDRVSGASAFRVNTHII